MFDRRQTLGNIILASAGVLTEPVVARPLANAQQRLADLEHRHGGKLGVAILDTATGGLIARRGDERFPICSVAKLAAAAFVLARVDEGKERLDRRVTYARSDLVPYSPRTEERLASGMTIAQLCQAAITLSDNTAYNLMLASVGGPSALTAFLRRANDAVTRADRLEPALNDVAADDVRDTTTPVAMARLMRAALIGTLLKPASRERLRTWLTESETGDKRLRAATPAGWTAGDKTGTGPRNATNDVAIFYPPRRPPIIVTAFYVDAPASLDAREHVLVEVGRIAVTAAGRP